MSVHNKLYVRTELFTPRVDGTDFTTADWAYLGTINQNMATTDEVTFTSVTYNNGSNTTKIQAGATSNYTLTLPVDDGLVGEVLQTNGSGVLSWTANAGGGDVVRGRYTEGLVNGEPVESYMDAQGIPADSSTETYAALWDTLVPSTLTKLK